LPRGSACGGVARIRGGETCHPRNVLTLLAALERCLTAQGVKLAPGAGVAAANASYAAAG
ncbi:MAG: hypothetical protein ACKOFW_03675, partial [Planctomycetaceae bacterium]